jgi:hypothetical protein
MGAFIARILMWVIFGWFIHETIDKFNKHLAISLNPYVGVVIVGLVFVFQEYAIRKWTIQEGSPAGNHSVDRKNRKLFLVIAWSLVIGLLLFVIMIWFGVLYKQIAGGLNLYQ